VSVLEHLPSAAYELARHKTRTLLTMLGIIFGVGAVISMLSIGAGAQAEALEIIDSMGLRNVIVRAKEVEQQDLYTIRERSLGLSLRDADEIGLIADNLEALSPMKRIRSDRVISGSGRSEGLVMGVGRSYFSLLSLKVAQGALFDREEEKYFQRVCVLGDQARRELFAFDDPIGESVKINDVWFTVVGILERQDLSKGSFQGVEIDSGDNSIFVPISTALKMFDRPVLESELDEIVMGVTADGSVEHTSVIVNDTLKELHGGEADFTMVIPQELLSQSQQTRRLFNIVMGGIAGISLLVGGIGIMNIMLASVLERTREIGVRRAVGAKRKDILVQFLAESVVISLFGGLLGVCLGFAIAWSVATLSEWNTIVTGFSIALSFGFSVAVGLIFGTYPAINASKLDPIDALRYE